MVSNAHDILGFTKDFGRMKAIMLANLQLCAMKALARVDWLPKGGLPNTMNGFVAEDGGIHVRKSCFKIFAARGSISIPILSYVSGILCRNAPLPAEGSIHK